MALKPFNSVGGFSVGETPSNVILANGDITTNNITTTGVANLNAVGNVIISGGTNGYYLQTNGSGNLTWAAVPTGTGISNGTSNVSIPTVNGNVNIVAGGNTTIVVTDTGANITGTGNFSGNVAMAGLLTNNIYYANGSPWDLQEAAGSNTQIQYNMGNNFAASANFTFNDTTNVLTVTGNIAASNANLGNATTSNFFIGSGNNLSNIQGANVSGAVAFATTANAVAGANVSGTVSAATTAGTVTTAAQPNITSVGTLTSLDVTGNISGGNANLGNLVTANFFAGTLTTNAQPNITSVGTLTSLDVTGNISGGNANLGNAATANFFIGSGNNLSNIQGANVSGAVAFATTANAVAGANVSGQVANALVAGTVYTNAQPNITSVGTLTSLDVTGNITSGNVYANSGTIGASLLAGTLTTASQPNVTSVGTLGNLNVTGSVDTGNVVTNTITGKTTGVTITAAGSNQNINLVPTGTGTVSVGNFKISNVATPTADYDAATKLYVDQTAQGLTVKASCPAATYEPLATSTGGIITYNNGTSGVGATLTVAGGTFATIDDVTLSNGDRVLVKNEATQANNGIYVRTSTTVLTRTADFDNTPTGEIAGAFTFITSGTINGDTGWVCTTDNPVTMGTTAITFTQFSGAGSYTAGTGLTLTGTQFNISNTAVTAASYGSGDSVATFTVNAQGQLTAAANVAITANAANLTGTTLNSGVTTSSLTSVGTLGNLAVTGNITSGNVYANSGIIGAQTLKGEGGNISNIAGANVTGAVAFATTANAVAGANVSGQVANALVAGTVYTNAQPNITSVGTLTSLDVTGNISGGNANLGNLVTANFFAGTLTTNAQPNITSVGTLTSLTVTGNVSSGNISATSANLTTANVTGNVIIGSTTVTAGTVTTTATTANTTIASFPVSGTTGIEYLVKGTDSAGSKYSVAKVVAVTNGTDVDYTVFATVNIGTVTGSSLQVVIDAGSLKLQVTPSSSNSTVWTTQYNLV